MNYKLSTEQRFWSKVNKNGPNILNTPCWIWTAGQIWGYGKFKANKKTLRSHRFSWELTYGPIPKNLLVCHICDNKICVNPIHLRLDNQQGNMNEMIEKKRDKKAKGESHYRAKLTSKDIHQIRKLKGQLFQKQIGIRYGVSQSLIS